jgi:glycosyltransferase involved in cell wall biosynthesis
LQLLRQLSEKKLVLPAGCLEDIMKFLKTCIGVLREHPDPAKFAKQHIANPQGLGDTLHNGIEWSGVGPKVRSYYIEQLHRDCGCNARREKWNRWWPYAPKRGEVFLSIGMPHFQDWEGAWATIQSVLWEALAAGVMDKIEIVVVDQSPESEAGKKVSGYLQGWVPRSVYVPMENLGTAQGKNAVFARARGEWVLLLDCHAAIKPGSLGKMFRWMAENRFNGDLYGGVMDLGAGYQWQRDAIAELAEWMFRSKRTDVLPTKFAHLGDAAFKYVSNRVVIWKQTSGHDGTTGVTSTLHDYVLGTDHGFHSHVDRVWQGDSLGRWATDKRATSDDAEPFEVDNLAGWFLFCRRDSWLRVNPYHPLMRGFGGEEGVMTLAFAKAGRKSFVAPFARATHRFGRADGVKFPLQINDRIRNYALAFHSLKAPEEMARMRHYFLHERPDPTQSNDVKPFDEAELDTIIAQAIADHEGLKSQQAERNAEAMYERAWKTPSDINEHVPALRELASECDHVTEISSRWSITTVALLAGRPRRLISIDRAGCQGCISGGLEQLSLVTDCDLTLVKADVLEIEIEETDGLLIDSHAHTAKQLTAELGRHADRVRLWIALHDTQIYGERADDGGPGLLPALRSFLLGHPEWAVASHTDINNGLTVLRRDWHGVEADWPKEGPTFGSIPVCGLAFEHEGVLQ